MPFAPPLVVERSQNMSAVASELPHSVLISGENDSCIRNKVSRGSSLINPLGEFSVPV